MLVAWQIWKRFGFFVASYRGIKKQFQSPALFTPPAVGHHANKRQLNMKLIVSFIFFSLIWNISFSQSDEIELSIKDKKNEVIDYLRLIINDSIILLPDISGKYTINRDRNSSSFHITSELYGYVIIDTLVEIEQNNHIINLSADILNNALLNEFNNGFEKKYISEEHFIVIGLKEDSTFIIKSFFHTSLAACFQFEKGNYRIVNNTLILNFNKYESPCLKTNKKFQHEYTYKLMNDEIIDFGKYSGFIEKTYFGQ